MYFIKGANLKGWSRGIIMSLCVVVLLCSSPFAHEYVDHVARKAHIVDSLRNAGVFTNDWILANYPDSVREPDQIGFEAGPEAVSLPAGVRKLCFAEGVDPGMSLSEVVDSIVMEDGSVVTPVDESVLVDRGISLDQQLLDSLLAYQAYYLKRSIPNTVPGETFEGTRNGELYTYDLSVFYHIRFPDTLEVDSVKAGLESIASLDDVYYVGIPIPADVQPPLPPLRCGGVNEPYYDEQWYLEPRDTVNGGGIDVAGAWALDCDVVTGEDVVIAIIDNGFGLDTSYELVDTTTFHPDLRPNIHEKTMVDFSQNTGCHGTYVAGVCAAAINNPRPQFLKPDPRGSGPGLGIGIAGTAYKSKMILTDYWDGTGYLDDIAFVLDSCPDVRVMNFSWIVPLSSYPPLEALLAEAYYEKEILLVAGAGNCGIFYPPCPYEALPGSHPCVIAVAACDRFSERVSWSNWGYVDFTAPGEDILTTGPVFIKPNLVEEHGYLTVSGTSMSSPMTAGVGALIMSAYPEITPGTTYYVLAETSEQPPDEEPGWNPRTGFGIVNAKAVVAKVAGVFSDLYCDYIPGDVDANCYVNCGDMFYLIDYLYYDGPPPPVLNNADVDGSCSINWADLSYLVNYLFKGGPPPVPGCVEDGGANNSPGVDVPMPAVALYRNYPNPFNPTTEIAFTLPVAGRVNLEIYNVLGQRVTTLAEGVLEAGEHVFEWDGTDAKGHAVSTGIYLYRLQAGDFVDTKKMVLMK